MGQAFSEQTLVALFKKQLKGYMGMDQSSVRLITGEKIISGVAYSLKEGEKASLREGLPALGKEPIEKLHEKGQRAILEQFFRAKELYCQLEKSELARLIDVNISLKDSFKIEIPQFFKKYDPVYCSAEIPCLLDYPLSVPIKESEQGVSYIYAYLEALEKEAKFIEFFQIESCLELFKNVPFNLKEDLQNLYEFVFIHHLCQVCLLGDCEGFSVLLLSRVQKTLLLDKWTNAPKEMENDLNEAFENTCNYFSIKDQDRIYYELTLKNCIADFKRRDQLGQLSTLLIEEKIVEKEEHHLGKLLPDEEWRMLYSDLIRLDDSNEKIKRIREKVNHIVDLIDLIKAEALTADEIADFMKVLSDNEKKSLKKYIETFEREVDSPIIRQLL